MCLAFGMMSISLKVSISLVHSYVLLCCCSTVKYFVLYVKTPSCEDILNVGILNFITCVYKFIIQNSEELYQVLREWFDSVCNCDGFNNLYRHQVSCVDDKVVNITSKVHSDDNNDKTAEMLIDLAKNNLQGRNPPEPVKISSDWILCLSEHCNVTTQEFTLYVKNIRCRNVRKLIDYT